MQAGTSARGRSPRSRARTSADHAFGFREQRIGEQQLGRRNDAGGAADRSDETLSLPRDVVAPVRQASAASSSCRKLGRPWRGSEAGSTCPRDGSPSGVRKTVIGQPPLPVMVTVASM